MTTKPSPATTVVGRVHELELMNAVLASGGNLVLEGPPGTSKTTLLKAITGSWGVPLFIAEGNADLTPSKLIGYHDPAAVLREGYTEENFLPGPLVHALRGGGILYLEELNRAPAETLNTLLTAMGDREIVVPRLGVVHARESFRVVASMNPFDNVGTNRLSPAVHDRLCRLAVDYQSDDAECAIVLNTLAERDGGPLVDALAVDAVALTRATRAHDDLHMGSSVRGAISLCQIGLELARTRGVQESGGKAYREIVWSAMLVALSGRVHVEDASDRTPEAVLSEIWATHFGVEDERLDPG